MRFLMATFIVLIPFMGCTFRTDPGTGKKIGKIVKLSKQGLLSKTWEGELIRGGLSDGSGTLGASFQFTIESHWLASEAEKYFESQEEVIIEYRVEGISYLTRSESSSPNFAVSIIKNERK